MVENTALYLLEYNIVRSDVHHKYGNFEKCLGFVPTIIHFRSDTSHNHVVSVS